MRRGTWILAVSGAMAFHAGGAFAADPFEMPGAKSAGPVSTRSTRAAAPKTKNYYEDLFGAETAAETPPPPAAEPTAPAKRAAAVKPAPTKSAKAPSLPESELVVNPAPGKTVAKRPESAPPIRHTLPDDGSKVFPASAESIDRSEKQVIQAGFEKSPGTSEKSFIQPVRADSAQPARGSATTSSAKASASATQTPSVSLEWSKRGNISVGQECQIELVVKNTGTTPATQIAVDAVFPTSIRLTSCEPKPAATAEKLSWSFDTLAPNAERRIALKLVPSRQGDLGATATVRFTGQASTVFKVEEPLLKLAIKGPSEVQLGDPATQIITVTNPGTGVAHDVKLEAKLSAGLEHRSGERLEIQIGSLGPGDSQQVRIGLSAIKGGMQTMQLACTSSCEASSSASTKINVIAPSLEVAVNGPGLRYKDRNAKYAVTVKNDGSVPNSNVRVSHVVPEGFQFVSAERGGKYEASEKTIHWFIGKLEAGQTVTLPCELKATGLGEFKHLVSVNSDSGVQARAHIATRVEGVASLDTEIVDVEDPVEVGGEAAWEVRVKNNGSKAATNIAVACELPEGVELIGAKGATESVAAAKVVTFKSLAQLAPGQQAIFRVQVRGVKEGTHRLRAKVSSDSLDQPVSIEEATKFYADAKN
jgi:hypothetical protein